MSDTARPLILATTPGGAIELRAPIPDLSVVTLYMLTAAVFREWVVVGEDGTHVDVCGHRFNAVGWLSGIAPPGVVLEHACCVS